MFTYIFHFYSLKHTKMKKQNIAVFLSSLMLLATLVPTLVAAQATQDASLTLTGEVDLFYEGYDTAGGSNPGDLQFAGLTASSSNQTTVLNYAEGAFIDNQFIGVLDLSTTDHGWNVTINGDATFTDTVDPGKTFEAVTLGYVTTPHGFSAAPTINCGGAEACAFATTLNNNATLAQDLLYYVDLNSGYTFASGVVTAPRNVDALGLSAATYTSIKDLGTGDTMLDGAGAADALGLFGNGVHFEATVPGGTGAGTYVATVTYDLNMIVL